MLYEIIKRPKCFGIRAIVFAGLIVTLSILEIPLYRDMIEKGTKTVVAEYVEFQSSNTDPGTYKAYFKGNHGRFHVYVPIYTRDIAKLEVGKTYEVEYFCYSQVIKEYKLLE
jgi:hypothetical protein